MSETYVVLAIFAVLLGLEWRYGRRFLRVATAMLALAVLWFYQPSYTWARRKALGTPPAERVILNPVAGSERDTLSEYHSGVYTTMRWVSYYHGVGAGARLAVIGALFWLACSPAVRQARESVQARETSPASGSGAPEA